MKIRPTAVLLALAVISMLMLAGWLEKTQLEVEQRQYCRMVKMFKDSGGAVGWPDYKESYDLECRK